MRVVFLGTPAPAVPSLDAIVRAGHDVPLVVTQPDRPAGRSKALRPSPVKERAMALGLTVIQPEKVRAPAFATALAAARPEALAVVAYGRLLVRPVLDVARHGAINVHFSMLPAYRGAAPVQWALARGERETGVTTFRIDEGLDTGDILEQRPLSIAPDERAPALLDRLAVLGAEMLVSTLAGLAEGTIRPVRQDPSRVSVAPLLTRDDGCWDPGWSARELAGRVRGFDPWPGVWALWAGRRVRLAEAAELTDSSTGAPPGTVLARRHDAITLACASGTVASIASVQPEGGRAMSASAAVNGRLISPKGRLESPRTQA
jgi:methionyl-tRNA formyltransferase